VSSPHEGKPAEFLWTEAGEDREGWVAEVAPLLPIDRLLSFAVPQELAGRVCVGRRVTVSVGKRRRRVPGFVVGLDRRAWRSNLDRIEEVEESPADLTEHLVALGRGIAEHYACPLGLVLKSMMPEAARRVAPPARPNVARLVRAWPGDGAGVSARGEARGSGEKTAQAEACGSGEETAQAKACGSGEKAAQAEACGSGEETARGEACGSGEEAAQGEACGSGEKTAQAEARGSGEKTAQAEACGSGEETARGEACGSGEETAQGEARGSGEKAARAEARGSGEKTAQAEACGSGEETAQGEARGSGEKAARAEARGSGEKTAQAEACGSGEGTGRFRLTAQRRALLDALSAAGGVLAIRELLSRAGVSRSVLNALVSAGCVRVEAQEPSSSTLPGSRPVREDSSMNTRAARVAADSGAAEVGPTLNADQQAAYEHVLGCLKSGGFSTTLLYGVSGSGKTEVYIRAMQAVVATGRQTMLLVPEILLTTQLVDRLSRRFAALAVVHSGLSDGQRAAMWRGIASGARTVVVGTRSAVFAPCPALGLICVDEEQETSYKNLQAPRFHVRDVALLRAKLLGIPVVLGSATPSLETWYQATRREAYHRVDLPSRIGDIPLPHVQIVDMRDERAERPAVISRALERLVEGALESGEQAIILMNRRGYAHRLSCPRCRTPVLCPHCSVALVVHRYRGEAMCHYCRRRVELPRVCPKMGCGGLLVMFGAGTQRVEEDLASRFPRARVCRADSDTMRRRDDYERTVRDFAAGHFDILLGTQMVAKGLDFPGVSVVGVIDAEIGAYGVDFRSQEFLFQLLTQVAGRAGRSRAGGRVVIQTMMPRTPAIVHAVGHDWEGFAGYELEARARAALPPFRRLTRWVVADEREERARSESAGLASRIEETVATLGRSDADVLGPQPCPIARIRGRYRYELVLRTHTAVAMHEVIGHLKGRGALRCRAERVTIDVDPVSLS
jgi:primosomal protein N' (replication factor Y)